ncbi:hypothetical protein [uncultured Fibrella sp.]|uniref:hypothetical protein n=1 Tax=uncultured Fibrella sp. TaxID=1284596 RepID=UPI0035CAFC20
MKNNIWILVLVLAGCHKEPDLSVQPGQLIGTWNSSSVLPSASKKPFLRWTFEPDYLYTLEDTSKTCQSLNNNTYYRYWIEDGDILVMRYMGISVGPGPTVDTRRRIVSITASEVVLDAPRQILEKCL